MALILCVGLDHELAEKRMKILEKEGHTVIPVFNQKELATACQSHNFDVVVLGHSLSSRMKIHIAELIRQHCKGCRILELYPMSQGRGLVTADSWIAVQKDVSPELAHKVNELVKAC